MNNVKQMVRDAICNNHRGKMIDMWSLSTSCKCNKYCLARMKNGNCICAHCFADAQTDYMIPLANKLERNTKLLTKCVIDVEDIPYVDKLIFRFESFGDLNNVTQLINYNNFCLANPNTTFALWTKNTFILKEARERGFQKPNNLIIVESAPLINVPIKRSDEWVDKTFTVFDKSFKGADFINCGDKKCVECQICYHLDTTDTICELLK